MSNEEVLADAADAHEAANEIRQAINRIGRNHGVSPAIKIQELDDGTWLITCRIWTKTAARQHVTKFLEENRADI